VDDTADLQSKALERAISMLARKLDLDTDAIIRWLEGRARLSQVAERKLAQEVSGCTGISYTVIDDPEVGYHQLIDRMDILDRRMARFVAWFTPAGIRKESSGRWYLINPYNERVSPQFTDPKSAEAYMRLLRNP